MKKNILFIVTIVFMFASSVFMLACSSVNNVRAFNKQIFDFNYAFNKAIINLHDEVITVDVETWTDYEDGEQIQIVATDGTVYLTSSYNCTLINDEGR